VVKCRFVTLTNLIAEKELMPEFVSAGSPKKDIRSITKILLEWCRNPDLIARRREQLASLAKDVAIPGATKRTAELILSELSPAQIQDNDAIQAA